MSLTDLLARVEASEGGADQWGVLRDVRLALVPFGGSGDVEGARIWIARFNTLCDAGGYESAALALVERVLPRPGHHVRSIGQDDHGNWLASIGKGWPSNCTEVYRSPADPALPTPALALLAALLKAMEAQRATS
jgi:hypothetical protein